MRQTIWDQFEEAKEWQPYFRMSLRRLPLITGGVSRSLYLMRRYAPDGTYQYRRMSLRELFGAIADMLPSAMIPPRRGE